MGMFVPILTLVLALAGTGTYAIPNTNDSHVSPRRHAEQADAFASAAQARSLEARSTGAAGGSSGGGGGGWHYGRGRSADPEATRLRKLQAKEARQAAWEASGNTGKMPGPKGGGRKKGFSLAGKVNPKTGQPYNVGGRPKRNPPTPPPPVPLSPPAPTLDLLARFRPQSDPQPYSPAPPSPGPLEAGYSFPSTNILQAETSGSPASRRSAQQTRYAPYRTPALQSASTGGSRSNVFTQMQPRPPQVPRPVVTQPPAQFSPPLVRQATTTQPSGQSSSQVIRPTPVLRPFFLPSTTDAGSHQSHHQ